MNRAWLRFAFLVGAVSCVTVGCGSDSGSESSSGGSGGSGNTGNGGSGATAGSGGTAGDGGTAGTSTNGGAAGSGANGGTGGSAAGGSGNAGNGGTGNTGNCPGATAWEVTYDLTGSIFEISGTFSGAGDQVNVVALPYEADDHWGPATMVIRFADVDGNPGVGAAQVVSYTATQDFVVNSTGISVHTDLAVDARPTGSQCGTAEGSLSSDTLAFTTPMRNYHTKGAITCTGGALCNLANPRDVDETKDQPLNSFTFTNGVSAFTMPKVSVPNTDNATTELSFIGTETGRTQVCACE
ncbi:MAG: hypothetical protein H6718_14560 [Polyangiaceae bacterium]|nr:hypothetical protein [Polyangiaceae bacterium]MCB9606126.1 hypothetical protein [Polyangiaceae bacterium]